MKFKKLEERFANDFEKTKHYKKHAVDGGVSKLPPKKDGKGKVYYDDNGKEIDYEYQFSTEEFQDANEYEKAADEFARTPVGGDIIGKVIARPNKNGEPIEYFNKYNTATGEFTAYTIENNEPINITYYYMDAGRKAKDAKGKTVKVESRWDRLLRNNDVIRDMTPEDDAPISK